LRKEQINPYLTKGDLSMSAKLGGNKFKEQKFAQL
jgi:hypothetical protein